MRSFNDVYFKVVENSAKELEKLRKKCLYRILICIIAAACCVFFGIKLNNEIIMKVGTLICIIVAIILLLGPASAYRKTYKEKVVRKFIKAYDERLEFWYNRGIPRDTYREGGFELFDLYSSEDLIIGNIDGNNMMIGEVHTKREKTYTDSEGNTQTREETIFHGLFGLSKLNNVYNGTVKIHSDKGILGKIFTFGKKLEMDSSEFEKYFDVYADDKIQVMQIFTADIMDMMLEFLKKSKIKFELTIKNENLYIRFKTGPMFEGNIFKSSVEFDTLKKVFDVINFTFDMTRALSKTIDETQL